MHARINDSLETNESMSDDICENTIASKNDWIENAWDRMRMTPHDLSTPPKPRDPKPRGDKTKRTKMRQNLEETKSIGDQI